MPDLRSAMSALWSAKLRSILFLKCPFCLQGDLFRSHPYDLSHVGEVHERCPSCGRKLSKEPGFYWGAMFVSYGLSIGFSLLVYGITWWIHPGTGIPGFFIVVVSATALASPYLYALSKVIWANFFFHYQR
jgi:uncharacterized protein (DUF983 family)